MHDTAALSLDDTTFAEAGRPDARDNLDLQCIRIFADAATVTLNRLAMACKRKHFAANQQILAHDSTNTDVMLLLSGRVKATAYSTEGREVAYRIIEAGEVFGDYSALDGLVRSADIVTMEESTIGQVSKPEFLRLVTADPAVAKAQMQELVGNIRSLSARVYELTTLRAGDRLIATLLRMATPTSDQSATIERAPTHSELAALISSQRHVVTTELAQLERKGLIKRNGRSIRLIDTPALQQAIGG